MTNCCTALTDPCYQSCDPPVPAHSNAFGCADFGRDFCTKPVIAGEKLKLTDSFLRSGHIVLFASFVVDIPSKTSVPFSVGTLSDPAKYGGGDLYQSANNVKGVMFYAQSASELLVQTSDDIYITMGADCNYGKLGIRFMLADSTPMGTRQAF